jgi:hypothetical protein
VASSEEAPSVLNPFLDEVKPIASLTIAEALKASIALWTLLKLQQAVG